MEKIKDNNNLMTTFGKKLVQCTKQLLAVADLELSMGTYVT